MHSAHDDGHNRGANNAPQMKRVTKTNQSSGSEVQFSQLSYGAAVSRPLLLCGSSVCARTRVRVRPWDGRTQAGHTQTRQVHPLRFPPPQALWVIIHHPTRRRRRRLGIGACVLYILRNQFSVQSSLRNIACVYYFTSFFLCVSVQPGPR